MVVGPSWVGDMVMAQSLLKILKQRIPEPGIDVLAPGWSLPLLERMPEVEGAIDMPVGHGRLDLKTRWRLGRRLRANGYRQAILLPNSFKSALVPFWAGIPRRTGWVGEMRYGLLNDLRKLDKSRLTMTVERFAALGSDDGSLPPNIPAPRLSVDEASVREAAASLGLKKEDSPVLALCPGAEYGPAKRWPEAHYAGLAAKMARKGWQVWLFGSHKDRPVCGAVAEGAGESCTDLCGRTSLAQAMDLLSLADAVVSNDSGLMHVAAALDRPLVAIYGSSDPGFTPPLSARSHILSLGLDCSPCFKRECPRGDLKCLENISAEQAAATLEGLVS